MLYGWSHAENATARKTSWIAHNLCLSDLSTMKLGESIGVTPK
jgi:hypothetical protein